MLKDQFWDWAWKSQSST